MLSKVEEVKSSAAASQSQNRVLNALMAEKKRGAIPGILGRLVSDCQALQKTVGFVLLMTAFIAFIPFFGLRGFSLRGWP